MEEADVLFDEGDAELLSRLDNGNVILAAQRGGNVLDSGTGSAVDVVSERELYA
jgi:hypothetical protein